jgi:drug/metabolite transporter (DMT)-like permease
MALLRLSSLAQQRSHPGSGMMPFPFSLRPGLPCRPSPIMPPRLTPFAILLLTIPPVLWAANSVIGRAMVDQVPPMMLNLLRWVVALAVLLPLGWRLLLPGSPFWLQWRRYSLLGLLGVGCYNAFQYLALETSLPLNVTLVASSVPIWMLAIGRLFYGQRIVRNQLLGLLLSICGVLVVMTRGDWHALLGLRLVTGDFYVLLAAVSWAFYSWELAKPVDAHTVRSHWPSFLLAQVLPGTLWSLAFTGIEWQLRPFDSIVWSWPVAAAILFIGIGPAIVAFRCWGWALSLTGPAAASFFINLTPLFAALFSAAFLGELPQLFHALAFVLIVGGIVVSSRR